MASNPDAHDHGVGTSAELDSTQIEPTLERTRDKEEPPPPRLPRIYHRKSRTGCAQCRARRIKCDEVHPVCGNCRRDTGECTYDRPKPVMIDGSFSNLVDRTPSVKKSHSSSSKKFEPPARELPESRSRRCLELRLLCRYMSETSTSMTIFSTNAEELKRLWTVAWPQKAFECETLLHAMFAVAALHWSKYEPDNTEATEAHLKYMGLTLSGHRADVTNLSKMNGDVVCLTSTLLRTCLTSGLSTRDLEPYSPPSFWLQATQASGQVWASSWKWIKDDETSISSALFKLTPNLLEPALMFHTSNRKDLDHLLRCNPDDDLAQLANPDILRAYETTLSYIGGIKIAIATGQPLLLISRLLTSFPMFINRNFTPLVETCQPRALVVLCHYFALLTVLRNFWWIGDTGEREIRAVEKFLPSQWRASMAWPIQVIEDPSILTLVQPGDLVPSSNHKETDVRPNLYSAAREYSSTISDPFSPSFRGE